VPGALGGGHVHRAVGRHLCGELVAYGEPSELAAWSETDLTLVDLFLGRNEEGRPHYGTDMVYPYYPHSQIFLKIIIFYYFQK
jgi:hypothetical protein